MDILTHNKIEDLDKKVDKLLSLIDDIKSGKQNENLMEWRVAALKKLKRTQRQIDSLIDIIDKLGKNLRIKENEDGEMAVFTSQLPETLNEYEQSHTLHLDYIIKRLTDIRNNIFKE